MLIPSGHLVRVNLLDSSIHSAPTRKTNHSRHNRDSDLAGVAFGNCRGRATRRLRSRGIRKGLGPPLDAGSRTATRAALFQAVSGSPDLGHSNDMRNAGQTTETVEPRRWKLRRNGLGRIGHHLSARFSSEASPGTSWPRAIYLVGRANPLFERDAGISSPSQCNLPFCGACRTGPQPLRRKGSRF